MDEAHCCNGLKAVTSSRTNFEIEIRDGGWWLRVTLSANREMVLDGEADYEGEEICSIPVPIKYCPFCGLDLSGTESTK